MHFGTYMGIFWILKFILYPLGFKITFLLILYACLSLAVPFIGYFYLKSYRDRVCDGVISFGQACLFTLLMYMFASLLSSVAYYVYFQFIDNGFIAEQYCYLYDTLGGMLGNGGNENLIEAMELAKDNIRSMTPINMTFSFLSNNIVICSIIAIPTALIGMRRRKTAEA